jgi:hypothetical protein
MKYALGYLLLVVAFCVSRPTLLASEVDLSSPKKLQEVTMLRREFPPINAALDLYGISSSAREPIGSGAAFDYSGPRFYYGFVMPEFFCSYCYCPLNLLH